MRLEVPRRRRLPLYVVSSHSDDLHDCEKQKPFRSLMVLSLRSTLKRFARNVNSPVGGIGLVCLVVILIVTRSVWNASRFQYLLSSSTSQIQSPFINHSSSVLFVALEPTLTSNVAYPQGLVHSSSGPNYSGLELKHAEMRTISNNDERIYTKERYELLEDIDERKAEEHDDEQDQPQECVRNNWKNKLHINCNNFHELNLERDRDGFDKKYLGHGYYRHAWLFTPTNRQDDVFVLKEIRMVEGDDDDNFLPSPTSLKKIQTEAVIMERLTSSPTIATSYGHCALSIMAENLPNEVMPTMIPGTEKSYHDGGYISQEELDKLQEDGVRPMNHMPLEEKLDLAIAMAESLAEIHGFFGGVIVHGDIHPVQYLKGTDGKIKLNDFNNAEIMDWYLAGDTYCGVDRGSWGGMYRSPEEFEGEPINEKADVYSFGNNLYVLLTGLWPFYDTRPYSIVMDKVAHNQRPYIDDRYRNRSFIEKTFVEVMEQCWKQEPSDRPEIFQILAQLRETKAKYDADKMETRRLRGG